MEHSEIVSRYSCGEAAARVGMDLSVCAFEMEVVIEPLRVMCW